jgi:hypothetical protein
MDWKHPRTKKKHKEKHNKRGKINRKEIIKHIRRNKKNGI